MYTNYKKLFMIGILSLLGTQAGYAIGEETEPTIHKPTETTEQTEAEKEAEAEKHARLVLGLHHDTPYDAATVNEAYQKFQPTLQYDQEDAELAKNYLNTPERLDKQEKIRQERANAQEEKIINRLKTIKPDEIKTVKPETLRKLNPQQLKALLNNQEAVKALSPDQIIAIKPEVLAQAIEGSFASKMSQLNPFGKNKIQPLPESFVDALTQDQAKAIMVQHSKIFSLSHLKDYFTADQIEKLTKMAQGVRSENIDKQRETAQRMNQAKKLIAYRLKDLLTHGYTHNEAFSKALKPLLEQCTNNEKEELIEEYTKQIETEISAWGGLKKHLSSAHQKVIDSLKKERSDFINQDIKPTLKPNEALINITTGQFSFKIVDISQFNPKIDLYNELNRLKEKWRIQNNAILTLKEITNAYAGWFVKTQMTQKTALSAGGDTSSVETQAAGGAASQAPSYDADDFNSFNLIIKIDIITKLNSDLKNGSIKIEDLNPSYISLIDLQSINIKSLSLDELKTLLQNLNKAKAEKLTPVQKEDIKTQLIAHINTIQDPIQKNNYLNSIIRSANGESLNLPKQIEDLILDIKVKNVYAQWIDDEINRLAFSQKILPKLSYEQLIFLINNAQSTFLKDLVKNQLNSRFSRNPQAFPTEYIKYVRPTEFSDLKPEQIANLRPEQIKALTSDQINALTIPQIKALKSDQINALTIAQITDIKESQIDLLIMIHLNQTVKLTPTIKELITKATPNIKTAILGLFNQKYIKSLSDLGLTDTKAYTNKEIRNAYKQRALQNHPDRSSSPNATQNMAEINIAYDTLINNQLLEKVNLLNGINNTDNPTSESETNPTQQAGGGALARNETQQPSDNDTSKIGEID